MHRVEMRPQLGGNYDSRMWCEGWATTWADPEIVKGPVTCMRCGIADKPEYLPNCEES